MRSPDRRLSPPYGMIGAGGRGKQKGWVCPGTEQQTKSNKPEKDNPFIPGTPMAPVFRLIAPAEPVSLMPGSRHTPCQGPDVPPAPTLTYPHTLSLHPPPLPERA